MVFSLRQKECDTTDTPPANVYAHCPPSRIIYALENSVPGPEEADTIFEPFHNTHQYLM